VLWKRLAVAAAVVLLAPSAHAQDEAPKRDRPPGDARERVKEDRVRVGPLLGIGFPRPLQIEGLVKIGGIVGLGLEYGFLPNVSISGVEASFKGVAGDFRLFPFKNALFVGARVGRQWLDGSGTLTIASASYRESMAAAAWFVNPRIGFLHTFGSGITIGIDAGIQLPIAATYERSGPATAAGLAQNTDVDRSLHAIASTLGNGVTPTVDLMRIGFLF
jgi:hypothetical protein